jgi:ubiquinol-cytochrome c reductase iron-sulfur subunit
MSEVRSDPRRRRFLVAATAAVGAVGGIAVGVPFVISMLPSARARAAGAPVEVDISQLEPGMMITQEWRGQPVWVVSRTPEMLAQLSKNVALLRDPDSNDSDQPGYCKNANRSTVEHPNILVVVGICTHLGCTPLDRFKIGNAEGMPGDWPGGFFCPCHGSTYDMSARVFKGVPAPVNLRVPPYNYLSDTRLLIGEDKKGA